MEICICAAGREENQFSLFDLFGDAWRARVKTDSSWLTSGVDGSVLVHLG